MGLQAGLGSRDHSDRESSMTLVPMTCTDMVRSEAWNFGRDISEREAEHVLWNYTGFPSFWPSEYEHPRDALRDQAHTFFEMQSRGLYPCARCGGEANNPWLCDDCDAIIGLDV